MYKLKIDDKEIEVPEGTTVLNAAKMAGIKIPTLCDHPALEPYGGCRLCLVEIEGARTLQPSCTLPVSDKMVVRTDTEKIKDARKFVLSMLFSERNHFCPYCQVSGSDCELQNAAYDEGMTHWPIQPNWQPYPMDASHPYFILEHNRCILCRRCVRACAELVGNFTLGMEERGANTILAADLGVPLGSSSCISCGVCVQICPTGALIDRWSAYRGQEIDLDSTKSICVGCSIGCGIEVFHRNNSLVKINGDWDAEINGGVLCEVGRFIPMDEKRERIVTPMVRKNGALKAATWEEALNVVIEKFNPLIGNKDNGVAAITSTRLPADVIFTFKQIFAEKFAGDMVTSTEEGRFTSILSELSKEYGQYESKLAEIHNADTIMTIGLDLTKDHQVAGFFIKRLIPKGVQVIPVSYEATGMDAFTSYSTIINRSKDLNFIHALDEALAGNDFSAEAEKSGLPLETITELSELLKNSENLVIVYGTDFDAKLKKETINALIRLAKKLNAKLISPKGKANSVVAEQLGLNKSFDVNGHQAAFVAIGDENPSQSIIKKLEGIPFLVVQASYQSALTAKADVILPVTTWLEQSGTYVTCDGQVQLAYQSLQPPVDVKSNIEVMLAIADRLKMNVNPVWDKAIEFETSVVKID
jgi:formate dehydrogenase major subunit